MQPEPREPPDREVHLRFPHQAAIMNDAQQEARQHQAQGGLGIDRRAADGRHIGPGHLVIKPRQIQHAVDPRQHVIVGNKVAQ